MLLYQIVYDMDMFISCIIVLIFVCRYVDMQDVVSRCPLDEQLWNARSEQFDCPITKMYHCLKNSKDELVELCQEVTSFYNKDGCPILVNSDGHDKIIAKKCPVTTNTNKCPENSKGMYLSYETYKYPSCFAPDVAKTKRRTELTTAKITRSKSSIHASYVDVIASKSRTTPAVEMDYEKNKIIQFPNNQKDENLGPVAGAVAAVIIVLTGVAGCFVFIRRRWKRNEAKEEQFQYNNNEQVLENYDDVRGIGFSPRIRVISLSTDDIARSLEEEDTAAAREDTTVETVEDVDDEEVFMTFEQLQSSRR